MKQKEETIMRRICFLLRNLEKTLIWSFVILKISEAFEEDVDLIVFRNAGPVANFKDKYQAFRNRVVSEHLKHIIHLMERLI